ncbi:MAG: VF530 family protein, partial [Serratia symbiotica]|nr:VF530 family protein [Serratia symbiotica]
MTPHLSKDPLHGVTLEQLLNKLVESYGWPGLAERIRINCFRSDPSIKSSLKFLRRTPWVRQQVEDLYIDMLSRASSDNPWLRG